MKGVGCMALVLVFNLWIGTLAFAYCTRMVFGKSAPTLVNVIGGLVAGEVVVPGAIVLYTLAHSDIIHPPLVKA